MGARRFSIVLVGAGLFAAIPPLAEFFGEPFLVSLFSRVLIYALAAASLDLILGFGGMVSFGHAAYFGVGAYTVGILSHHGYEGTPLLEWPFELAGTSAALLAWPSAVLISALFAAVIGALCLRTAGIHFIMITLAFAQMLYFMSVSLERYGGDDGLLIWERSAIPGIDLADDVTFYYVCLGALASFVFLAGRLVNSRFGMVIRGAKQNERRMHALGFPVYRYRLTCFVLAGAGAGLAGALIANQTEFVSPELLHWTRSGEILVMVILGGMGTLYGPVLGATALLLLEELFSTYTEHWSVFLGPALVLAVLFARRGLFGFLAGGTRSDG